MQPKATAGVGHRTTLGGSGRRAFALFACALMLSSLVPQSALAQVATPRPATPSDIANLEVRIEEQVASAYNATARVNTMATGRIIVNNTANRTITNATIRLNSTTATSLDINNTITVSTLPPGESVVATYRVITQPRLSLSHDWRSITYEEFVQGLFQSGKIDLIDFQVASGPHRTLHGRDNLLEFNLTVVNIGTKDLRNVALTDLLPNQTVNGSLVAISTTSTDPDPYGGVLAYDNASDSLVIPLFRNNTRATLTLRATLPASAFGSPDQDFLDMRHEIRTSYTIQTTATQELRTGVTPEQQKRQEVLKQAVEIDDTQRKIQESLDVSEVTQVLQTLETEAWSLPEKLWTEAFARARNLGIPVDTDPAFGNELDRQVRAREGEVLKRQPALMDQFKRIHETKIENYAKIAGSIHKQGNAIQNSFGELGIEVNESLRNEQFQRIAGTGYDRETKGLLRAQGLNESQIASLRNFTVQHLAELSQRNITQAHDRLRNGYLQAIGDSANLSVSVLQNAMFFNREANLTRSPSLAWLETLEQVQGKAEAALADRNWSALLPAARDLATMLYFEGLLTGAPLFAQKYRNATIAWAAAEVALSGDNESAARMVEGLLLESHIYVTRTSPLFPSVNTGQTVTVSYSVTRVVTREVSFSFSGTINPPGPSVSCSGETFLPIDRVSAPFSCTAGPFSTAGNYNVGATVTSEAETFIGAPASVAVVAPTPTPTPTPTSSPTASPGVSPPPPGQSTAVGVTQPIAASITIEVLDATSQVLIGTKSGIGRVELPFTGEAGHLLRVTPVCAESTATHTLSSTAKAEVAVVSGVSFTPTATCTYTPKPEIILGSIFGVAVDTESKPVPVTATANGFQTSSVGFFGLTVSTPKSYSVSVASPGLNTATRSVSLSTGQNLDLGVIQLRTSEAKFLGTVRELFEFNRQQYEVFQAWGAAGFFDQVEFYIGLSCGPPCASDPRRNNVPFWTGYALQQSPDKIPTFFNAKAALDEAERAGQDLEQATLQGFRQAARDPIYQPWKDALDGGLGTVAKTRAEELVMGTFCAERCLVTESQLQRHLGNEDFVWGMSLHLGEESVVFALCNPGAIIDCSDLTPFVKASISTRIGDWNEVGKDIANVVLYYGPGEVIIPKLTGLIGKYGARPIIQRVVDAATRAKAAKVLADGGVRWAYHIEVRGMDPVKVLRAVDETKSLPGYKRWLPALQSIDKNNAAGAAFEGDVGATLGFPTQWRRHLSATVEGVLRETDADLFYSNTRILSATIEENSQAILDKIDKEIPIFKQFFADQGVQGVIEYAFKKQPAQQVIDRLLSNSIRPEHIHVIL